jgi:hypothetical protein
MIVDDLLDVDSEDAQVNVTKTTNPQKKARLSNHKLEETKEKCARNRKIRKRCVACYNKLTTEKGSETARKLSKRVTTFCVCCEGRPFICIDCFPKHV